MMADAPPLPRWRRVPPTLPIVLLGIASAAILLYLARSMTFWQDEWGSILYQGTGLDILRPVNEHWSTIPLLLYRATFGVVGLHTYLPYVAQVILLHLVAVAAAFVLIRTRCGTLVATLVCVPLLLLGSGSENLFWAFQTGFVGSVAFGLWGLALLDRPGRPAAVGAAILLLLSVMSSGMGLFFLVAAAGRTLLDPAARRRAVALLLPGIAYGAWYLTVGKDPVARTERLAGIGDLAGFVGRGIGHAVGATTGLGALPDGEWLGLAIFGIVAVATGWAIVVRRPPPALAAGALLGIAAMYTLIGVVRAELASDFATRSRYVYVAAFLMALVIADWVSILAACVAGRPRAQGALIAGLSVVLVATIVANLAALGTVRDQFAAHAELTRAWVARASADRDAPWIDPDGILLGMSSMSDVLKVIDRSGSPVRDDVVPSLARKPGAAAREAALLRLVGSGFQVEPAGGDVPGTVPLAISGVTDATVDPDGGCLTSTPTGRRPRVIVQVPTGTRLQVTSTDDDTAVAWLGLARPPSLPIDLGLRGGVPSDIVVPDIGNGSVWSVRLDLPTSLGPVRLCGVPA